MTANDVIRQIGEVGIIPVVRASSVQDATRAVEAIYGGGISIVEITMTVPDAVSVIREVGQLYRNKVLVGAGTVTTAKQAEQCLLAGAEFLVSPGLSLAVLSVGASAGILTIPGALTPSELMTAQEHGSSLVKIFPCGSVGGPKYLKSLRGPFPHASLIPTGGVNLANVAEFIAAGAFALGVGAELVDAKSLREGNLEKISNGARALVDAVKSARAGITH